MTYEDTRASLLRSYRMTYYEKSGSDPELELYDLKTKKLFLKRLVYPGLKPDQLFVGAFITICSRQMKIADYGDIATRSHFESATTLALLCQLGNDLGPALIEIAQAFNFQNIKLMGFQCRLRPEVCPNCQIGHIVTNIDVWSSPSY